MTVPYLILALFIYFSIDAATNEVTNNITSVGDSPVGIAINSISNKLYVSNIASNTVAVIDTNNINSDDTNNLHKTETMRYYKNYCVHIGHSLFCDIAMSYRDY